MKDKQDIKEREEETCLSRRGYHPRLRVPIAFESAVQKKALLYRAVTANAASAETI